MGNQTEIIMPVLGMSQDSGRLVSWLKQAGEWVEKGEPLMEVETDKTTVEIEAPVSGYLTQISAKEGEDIPVTQVIAILQDSAPEDQAPSGTVQQKAGRSPQASSSPRPVSPLAARIIEENQLDPGEIKSVCGRIEKADVINYLRSTAEKHKSVGGKSEWRLASPKARRLADELGVDLAQIQGTGPDGSILAADVQTLKAVQKHPAPRSAITVSDTSPESSQLQETEFPVSTIWTRMIERFSQSWPTTPHFYLMREVNCSRLVDWRKSVQEQIKRKITFTDLLVKLVAASLQKHPRVNAFYQDGRLLLNQEINIGLAVAIEEGLIVPVIHGADKLSIIQIAKARAELVERARERRLRLEDLQNGTFTFSNLGMYEIDVFNAIINPPQAAILSIGQIADRCVAIDGKPSVQPMMVLSASFDHRVVDGARGAQFLKTLADLITEPMRILK